MSQDCERRGKPSFEEDLRKKLTEKTLEEMRTGRMEDYGFERLVANVLRTSGASQPAIVSRSNDEGVDIYATFLVAGVFQQVVGVQVKHYKPDPPIGGKVVQQLINGIESGQEPVTLGMVITSGTFDDEAEEEAEKYRINNGIPIELVDGELLAKLIVENGLENLNLDTFHADL
ncbi:restriction endonuclease [Fodinicurvata halophila]|uniref:restriction endonuclease n=1 Tax=Fodinicurvata halophila TaxID=1419723 RepID=UPI003642ECDA